jgi:superfamily I DNA and/or RNA helicase
MIMAKTSHVMLDCQFRMYPMISAFPNKQFYDVALRNGVTERQRLDPRLICFRSAKLPIVFINCDVDETQIGRSFANELEAAVTSKIVRIMIKGR